MVTAGFLEGRGSQEIRGIWLDDEKRTAQKGSGPEKLRRRGRRKGRMREKSHENQKDLRAHVCIPDSMKKEKKEVYFAGGSCERDPQQWAYRHLGNPTPIPGSFSALETQREPERKGQG